ncbi:MAG: ParB N-terminal domain-containing protein [Deltaproteobacteria bacterium]|nr:ParB N-terminal domain-containing protein [Deltaproteobacteria bacterium]
MAKKPEDHRSEESVVHHQIRLEDISAQRAYQARECLDDEVIEEYREAMQGGARMPPVKLFRSGDELILVDGYHRYYAAEMLGALSVEAEIIEPTTQEPEAEALSLALAANQTHGLRRSAGDKIRAIHIALDHPWYKDASLRRIAEICGCSHELVRQVKGERDGTRAPRKQRSASTFDISPWASAKVDDNEPFDGDDTAPPSRSRVDEVRVVPESEDGSAIVASVGVLREAQSVLAKLHHSSQEPVIKEALITLRAAIKTLETAMYS